MKDGVKDDFFSLEALAKNLMLFLRGLQLGSRPCIFSTWSLWGVLSSF